MRNNALLHTVEPPRSLLLEQVEVPPQHMPPYSLNTHGVGDTLPGGKFLDPQEWSEGPKLGNGRFGTVHKLINKVDPTVVFARKKGTSLLYVLCSRKREMSHVRISRSFRTNCIKSQNRR